MARYLLQIGDNLYGYDDILILRIHLLENKPETFSLFETDGVIIVRYRKLSQDETSKLLNESQNETGEISI